VTWVQGSELISPSKQISFSTPMHYRPFSFTLPTSIGGLENDLEKIPGVSSILGGPAAPPAARSSDLGARE
jgi:hypothetical protein